MLTKSLSDISLFFLRQHSDVVYNMSLSMESVVD